MVVLATINRDELILRLVTTWTKTLEIVFVLGTDIKELCFFLLLCSLTKSYFKHSANNAGLDKFLYEFTRSTLGQFSNETPSVRW